MVRQILFFVILLNFASCVQESSKSDFSVRNVQYDDKARIQLIDSYPIMLDSLTGFKSFRSPAIFTSGEKTIFSFFNSYSFDLYFFDLENKSLTKTIHLQKEGPDGVGNASGGVFVLNEDSIFVADIYTLYLLNRDAKIVKKYDFSKLSPSSQIYVGLHSAPIFDKENNIILECVPDRDVRKKEELVNFPVAVKLNLKTGQMNYVFNLPDVYAQNIYAPNFVDNYFTFAEKTNALLLSFPVQSFVYELKLDDNNFIRYNAKSKMIAWETFEGFKKVEKGFAERVGQFLMSDSYAHIFYDKYNEMCLRLVRKSISKEDFIQKNWQQQVNLMILDKEFNVLGEQEFSDTIFPGFIGFASDGLFLLEWKEEEEGFVYVNKYKYSL